MVLGKHKNGETRLKTSLIKSISVSAPELKSIVVNEGGLGKRIMHREQ